MRTAWNEPFERFQKIFDEAKQSQPKDPNQMWLATVNAAGKPQVRVVLLKGFDASGFVFFTNYESMKGTALDATHVAALCFYWPSLEQQVRVEGTTAHVSAQESDEYFATRPRLSQIGAWASHQSRTMSSREELEARVQELERQYEGATIPRPPHWGGFRLHPERIEFWKAHPFRLHWREQYVKEGPEWAKSMLNP